DAGNRHPERPGREPDGHTPDDSGTGNEAGPVGAGGGNRRLAPDRTTTGDAAVPGEARRFRYPGGGVRAARGGGPSGGLPAGAIGSAHRPERGLAAVVTV